MIELWGKVWFVLVIGVLLLSMINGQTITLDIIVKVFVFVGLFSPLLTLMLSLLIGEYNSTDGAGSD